MGALYGTTINAADPFMRPLTDDQAILRQAIVLRLSTQRGTLWTDPEYGFAVTELLNDAITPDTMDRLPSLIQAELEKDERIAAVSVEAAITGPIAARVIRATLRVTPVQGEDFAMVLDISEVTVEVILKGSV